MFAWLAIAGHGATFLTWKTDGRVADRSRRAAAWLYGAVTVLVVPLTIATGIVNAGMLSALPHRPLAWMAVTVAIAGLATVGVGIRKGRDLLAFLGSSAFLAGMLAATAACLFPVLLRALGDDTRSLTAYNSSAADHSLRIAIRWWPIAISLVLVYFALIFRIHRGKVVGATGREGY